MQCTYRLTDGNIASIHVNLGSAYVSKKEYDSAIASYRTALDIQGDNIKARYNLGLALFYTKKYKEALFEVEYCKINYRELHFIDSVVS